MKMRFLNLVLGSLLAVSTLILPVKKAEAGIAILTAAVATGDEYYYYGGGVIVISSGYGFYPGYGLEVLALMLIILDEKGNLDPMGIQKDLNNQFPFIDNQNVLQNLSDKIAAKYNSRRDQTGNAVVFLSEEEILDSLAPLELSSEQTNYIVSSLR